MEIVVHKLSHHYTSGRSVLHRALQEVTFTVPSGAFVSLLGRTGSGKSTLIQHMNGLLRPTSGEVRVGPHRLGPEKGNVGELRQAVGMVFQYPEHQLFAGTVFQDVAFGLQREKLGSQEMADRVKSALEDVGLDYEKVAERSPFTLSGGEKRRVALAGVLVMKPQVLVLDEPTVGLDPQGRREVLDWLWELNRRCQVTLVMVTHDVEEAASYSDLVAVLDAGKLVLYGTPTEVLTQAETLTRTGLEIPEANKLVRQLNGRLTPPLPQNIVTIRELEEALLQRWQKGREA